MMIRLATTTILLALLAIGGGAFGLLIGMLPSIDREARVPGVFGDWRVPIASALYNRSDYLFQVGFGLLQGDLVASAATEERDELASIETALDRARRAQTAFEGSLSLAPGNAYTWTYWGWAAALQGDLGKAQSALMTSWALSPWNAHLSPSRLSLFELLLDLEAVTLADTEFAPYVERDLRVLGMHNRRFFDVLAGEGRLLRKWTDVLSSD